MIYEVYSKEGIPIAIEFSGSLEDVISLICSAEILYGKDKHGKGAAFFVNRGDGVLHVLESDEDWDKYIIITE